MVNLTCTPTETWSVTVTILPRYIFIGVENGIVVFCGWSTGLEWGNYIQCTVCRFRVMGNGSTLTCYPRGLGNPSVLAPHTTWRDPFPEKL